MTTLKYIYPLVRLFKGQDGLGNREATATARIQAWSDQLSVEH